MVRQTTGTDVHRQTDDRRSAAEAAEVLTALRELVEALDRRVPHLERSGEIQISKDAALLRNEAVTRIATLQRAGLNRTTHDQELVDAIMTDDGSPTPVGEERRADGTGRLGRLAR
jgi:hypothetical protein